MCTCWWRIVRKRFELEAGLYQILQILSLTLIEKTPILCALQAIDQDANFAENVKQLILVDLEPDSREPKSRIDYLSHLDPQPIWSDP